jgi:hypothetical protein
MCAYLRLLERLAGPRGTVEATVRVTGPLPLLRLDALVSNSRSDRLDS